MELLGYQRPVYERFSRLVDKEGRCAIVLPTGLGKFFLAAQWAVDNPGTSFLHVVPHRDISDHQMACPTCARRPMRGWWPGTREAARGASPATPSSSTSSTT